MVDGKAFTNWIHHALGEPENPMPLSATREKFRDIAGTFLSKKSMDRIEMMLDVSGLTDSAETLFDVLSESNAAL